LCGYGYGTEIVLLVISAQTLRAFLLIYFSRNIPLYAAHALRLNRINPFSRISLLKDFAFAAGLEVEVMPFLEEL
jgi:hypothetical protein